VTKLAAMQCSRSSTIMRRMAIAFSAHPCWDANGAQHSCDADSGYPYLSFRYTDEGELKCECSVRPQYQSTYIAKVKCSGHWCDNDEHPILDFDKDQDKCLCRSDPCKDLDGVKHTCDAESGFPLMHYREEDKDGKVKRICECRASVSKTPSNDEL